MGEYASYKGNSIKIGTCEDMYYLRWDQAHLVTPEANSLDPVKDKDLGLRFRFPFPSEDHLEPGEFDDYGKSLAINGMASPDGVGHYSMQLRNDGYVVSLPCPYDTASAIEGVNIKRNGGKPAVNLVQQRWVDGHLLPILQCGGCGSKWRAGSYVMLLELDLAIKKLAAEELRSDSGDRVNFWLEVANRAVHANLLAAFAEPGKVA